MAEEAKKEVAPPAPEPAKDIADEKAAAPEESKALVVAESMCRRMHPWLGAEELHKVRCANLFMFLFVIRCCC